MRFRFRNQLRHVHGGSARRWRQPIQDRCREFARPSDGLASLAKRFTKVPKHGRFRRSWLSGRIVDKVGRWSSIHG